MGPTGKVKGWMDRHVMVVLHVESWLPKELKVPVLLAAGVSCRVLGSSSSMSSTNSSPSKSLNLSSLPSMTSSSGSKSGSQSAAASSSLSVQYCSTSSTVKRAL